MAEDEEVEMIMFPPSKDQLQAFTGKELSQFLKKKGFPVDQCHILEGMFFSHSFWLLILCLVTGFFPPKFGAHYALILTSIFSEKLRLQKS